MKKLFATLMVVCMVFGFTATAMAEDSAVIHYDSLKWVAGDVDCNEAINADDLTQLKKVLLGKAEAEREDTADTNKDTAIDVRDLVHLKKALA